MHILPRRLRPYLVDTSAPDADQLEADLFRSPSDGSPPSDMMFDQYKLYVEMADRVSARRAAANTFFLTLNTLVFTAIGVFWKNPPSASPWLGVFPTLVLVLQCLVWFLMIRSYRQLNAGKWAVVGAFEKRLPASPWWGAEWTALGRGRDPARYWPISHVEQWIPLIFAGAYIGGFIALAVLA